MLPERSEPRSDARTAAVVPGLADVRDAVVTISRSDAEVVAHATGTRYADPRAEAEREAVLHEVILAARELHQSLREQTLHALAEYRGSHSAWDVNAEGRVVYAALERYSLTMRRAAARLRQIVVR